jgi:hypothetical protein
MSRRLSDFYIIGAMKCATSTLHEQLARRDRFFMTEPKEPNFFNDEHLYETGWDEYRSLFAGARPDQITGESSTHYTKLPTYQGTVDRIFEHTPNARLVYVMRDPVDRMVSQYVHEWTEREVDCPISEAVQKYPRLIAYSKYATQLEPFLTKFGRERVLPVFFEHLVTHREQELERVARFVGDDSDEPFVWHEKAAQTNVSKERLRKSAFRDKVLSFSMARQVKDALPNQWKEKIKAVWRMENRPQLSTEARKLVEDELDADLKKLGALLGLSLNCATFAQVARESAPTFTQIAAAESA